MRKDEFSLSPCVCLWGGAAEGGRGVGEGSGGGEWGREWGREWGCSMCVCVFAHVIESSKRDDT